MSEPFEFPAPGATFERFEILEEIGSGAFARVYRARSPDHPQPIALKLTALPDMSTDLVQRAVREIAVLRSLSSPHVVELHGSSIGSDHVYLVMELLEGKALNQVYPVDTPMDAGQALEIMLQVCVGLAEAHARGVVHRDLKPANIWVQPDGIIKVLDFGLARAWGVPRVYGRNATTTRSLVGTPHYCQPEQLHTAELSPASDVYSLATILYELLCGHTVLFPDQPVSEVIDALYDKPMAWLDAHATLEAVPITRYPCCAALPPRLVELIMRSLAKDPLQRPQLAGQLASEIGDILHADLGSTAAGAIEIHGARNPRRVALLPGRRRVGAGEICDVQVTGVELLDVHALIDWSGRDRPAQIRPAAPSAPIEVDGVVVRDVATLPPRAQLSIGGVPMTMHYPTKGSTADTLR